MRHKTLSDLNVSSYTPLPTPLSVKEAHPIDDEHFNMIQDSRESFKRILRGEDKRLALVIGPCSIHDTKAGFEYAERLKSLSDKVSDKIFILMRVYFTKPRTTTGWKGLINDPHLNDSFKIDEGLNLARSFLRDVVMCGLPTATEALDPVVPQYIDDLLTWNAIGARTAESQNHREMASGLSTPVGFKNGTDGNIQVAMNAMLAAQEAHHFLGISIDGKCAVLNTRGNPDTHLVLRGGLIPNYDGVSVREAADNLAAAGLCSRILVDCSHGNSLKDHARQELVFKDCINQVKRGDSPIFGLMVESNLVGGKQSISDAPLTYGQSITDACIDWDVTERIILDAAEVL